MLITIYILVFYDFDRVEVARELEQANQVLASYLARSSAPRRPASTHPWRKPLLKPKRTKSLDNNIVEYGNDLLEDNHSSSSNSFSNFILALLLKSSFSNKSGRLALVRLIDSFLRHRAISA